MKKRVEVTVEFLESIRDEMRALSISLNEHSEVDEDPLDHPEYIAICNIIEESK